MKIKHKILGGLLAVNLAFAGLGASSISTNVAHATSTENPALVIGQRNELERAVNDVINVVNTDVYYNYTSQELKAQYEAAIENARVILAKGELATLDELKDATLRINKVKNDIYDETLGMIQRQKTKDSLRKAIEANKLQASVARNLLDNFPKTVKRVSGKLRKILTESEALVIEAEQLLASL